jgi:hypothetical protein
MRRINKMAGSVLAALMLAGGAMVPAQAEAATLVILTDPLTLARRMVVVDPGGPDRLLICSVPPAVAGCQQLPWKIVR